MLNSHLHILHCPFIPILRENIFLETRLNNLFEELEKANVKDYTIIDGFYNPDNTKEAIHKGHRRIVELAKQSGMPNVIIAEDDIVFSSPNSYDYFLSQIPEHYDLFCGLIYSGEVVENKILNGASGIMTLLSIHERFYDFFLSLDTNTHIDRELGNTAFKHEYLICNPMVCYQRGGYSFNRRQELYYDAYLVNKELYKTI